MFDVKKTNQTNVYLLNYFQSVYSIHYIFVNFSEDMIMVATKEYFHHKCKQQESSLISKQSNLSDVKEI